ncbi:hypothetical protein NL676_009312 [Syzygium grande]|nr:hypothetical protein NL676_009312 [Syzygium grande]
MNSPCLREQVSIILQLGFLGTLLLVSLGKLVRLLGNWSNTTDQATERHLIGNQSSIINKSSIVCTALVLGTHLAMLSMRSMATTPHVVLKLIGDHANSILGSNTHSTLQDTEREVYKVFMDSKGMVDVQCPLICFLYNSRHQLYNFVPQPLKDTRLRELHVSASLQWTVQHSICGQTGMVFSNANGMREPLLSENVEKHSESERESLYGKATLLQLITFSWLNPLFAVGIKKPLEQNDVPDLDIKDSAAFNSHSFSDCLKQVKDKEGAKNPSIYKAIFFFIRKKAAINALFAVVNAGASYVGPYLIDDFVNFLTDKRSRSLGSGYLLALAFLGAKMVETIAQRQWIFGARQLGCRLRVALISHMYKKGLVLSSQSCQSHTGGEVINYMSVDVQRITLLIWFRVCGCASANVDCMASNIPLMRELSKDTSPRSWKLKTAG